MFMKNIKLSDSVVISTLHIIMHIIFKCIFRKDILAVNVTAWATFRKRKIQFFCKCNLE